MGKTARVAAMCLFAAGGAAPAAANDVDVTIVSKVSVGDASRVKVKIHKGVEKMELKVSAPGLGTVHKTVKRKGVGETAEFVLPPQKKPGVVTWRGTLKVTFVDEAFGQMPLSFQTEAVAGVKVMPVEDKMDTDGHTMAVRLDRVCDKLEVDVFDIDGQLIAHSEPPCAGKKPGEEIAVSWTPKTDRRVFRIRLTATDPDTIFGTTESYPYRVEVEHEEVQFETGKADILPDQRSKLEAVLPKIKAEAQRAQKGFKAARVQKRVRLFIIGHTDTVGPAGANQALSERRARAIAGWFAQQGLGVDLYARGYGESMPKVATPDETDEQQNRRVDYILAVESPTGSLSGWRKVR